MKNKKLIIGKIPYANLFPAFYYLEKKSRRPEYKFISGVPSDLNKMLRQGRLDASPSSSIEYLRHKDKYSIIPWFSISASGPVRSIFLFSKTPIEDLDNKTIAVTSHSDTSVVLLKIILKDFLSINCKFKKVKSGSLKKNLADYPACLLIGDEAMKAAKKVTSYKLRVTSKKQNISPHPSLFTYDLGELWFKHTGLPFVFALWIVRKKALEQKGGLIRKLSLDLIAAKKYAVKNLSLIAREARQNEWLPEKELIRYWRGISYDFTERHMEGLRLFEQYALNKT
ncbi:MAG: menaquinone biosynthesis protein [Nitrospirae bacterium]|nr:menaquinone biosynthesis protein [Nitrospirota bacterium]